MTTDRDMARIVRSWLSSDEHESADRVLENVFALLDATPQRRSWWPAWRIADMNLTAKLATAAAAMLVVALGIVLFFPRSSGVGGPGPTPSPEPTSSPSAAAAASSAEVWPTGPLTIGRHSARMSDISFSFDLPTTGWTSYRYTGMIEKGTYPSADYRWIGLGMEDLDTVATDPCAGLSRTVGPTVDDLATALHTIPGTHGSQPVRTTVGGLPATLVSLNIDHNIACSPSSFWLFGEGSAYPNAVDSLIREWIFEVNGQRVVIHADQAGRSTDIEEEIQQIVESIQFD